MPAFLSHAPSSDASLGADVLIVPVGASTEGLPGRLKRLGSGVASAVTRALDIGDFEPRSGKTLLVHSRGMERFPRILLLGLGEGNRSAADVRQAFHQAMQEPVFSKADSVAVHCGPVLGNAGQLAESVAAAVDGLQAGSYVWTIATQDRPRRPGRYVFLAETTRVQPRVDEGIEQGKILANAVSLARDLANTPANLMSPEDLGKRAREIAKECGLKVRVLEGEQIRRERLEAIRMVGAGSSRGPRLIALEYRPRGAKGDPIALVGKGLVYDTGGLSIKPTASMAEMKFDKCGACVVLGAIAAIAKSKLPVPVVAVVPAVENSISGDAYRPGDIIGSRAGKTIEVLNTDAEGRLALADALDYAITKFSPRAVVDVATLTGAVVYALGDQACAVLGNDDDLVDRIEDAGHEVGERAWPLPLWDEYLEDVKSPVADLKNIGSHGAGTIIGAAFLESFVGEVPWAHLDVAGVSRDRRNPKVGATGFGVRLLTELVRRWPKSRG